MESVDGREYLEWGTGKGDPPSVCWWFKGINRCHFVLRERELSVIKLNKGDEEGRTHSFILGDATDIAEATSIRNTKQPGLPRLC